MEPHFILQAGEGCPSTNPSEAEQPVVIVKALRCDQRSGIPSSRSGAVTRSAAARLDAQASGTWPLRRQESRWIHTCITQTAGVRPAGHQVPTSFALTQGEPEAQGAAGRRPGRGSLRWGSRPPVTAT